MPDCLVTCVTKPDRLNQHERITHVGNPAAGWIWTTEQVVTSIEGKTNTFYTVDPVTQKRADIGVVREAGKQPYLRTYADGLWNDNLLALTECPLR